VRQALASAGGAADLASRGVRRGGERLGRPKPTAPEAASPDAFAGPGTTAAAEAKARGAAGAVDQQACVAAATARAGRTLRPAFLVQTGYRGRPATVLVTAAAGDQARVELWVFPRGDCSVPPLASERVA
jgi:hypothetical protein